jgi:hypothetical protein
MMYKELKILEYVQLTFLCTDSGSLWWSVFLLKPVGKFNMRYIV